MSNMICPSCMSRIFLGLCLLMLQSTVAFVVSPASRHLSPLLMNPFTEKAMTRSSSSISSSASGDGDDEPQWSSLPKLKNKDDDVNDRFKYKVHALMGSYDPINSEDDTEENTGNILSALVNFPTRYTFTAVGKTDENDQAIQQEFVAAVESVIRQHTTTATTTAPVEAEEEQQKSFSCTVTPRGKRFTKVTIEVQVESAAIVTTIYEQLKQLDRCVMQF